MNAFVVLTLTDAREIERDLRDRQDGWDSEFDEDIRSAFPRLQEAVRAGQDPVILSLADADAVGQSVRTWWGRADRQLPAGDQLVLERAVLELDRLRQAARDRQLDQ